MLQVFHVDVAKEDLDVAKVDLDVMDAEFRCCRYVMLGVVSRGRREEGP
jgi:hypothetical protein